MPAGVLSLSDQTERKHGDGACGEHSEHYEHRDQHDLPPCHERHDDGGAGHAVHRRAVIRGHVHDPVHRFAHEVFYRGVAAVLLEAVVVAGAEPCICAREHAVERRHIRCAVGVRHIRKDEAVEAELDAEDIDERLLRARPLGARAVERGHDRVRVSSGRRHRVLPRFQIYLPRTLLVKPYTDTVAVDFLLVEDVMLILRTKRNV